MKTIDISRRSKSLNALLDKARRESLIVRAADGSEFLLSAVDEFDHEIAQTRRNKELMKFLEARARQSATISLDEVKKRLRLGQDGGRARGRQTKPE